MGNNSNYTLLLGVKLSLEEKVVETNPNWKGYGKDKTTPPYILSDISTDDYYDLPEEQRCQKDDKYVYGEKEIELGYVLPNGAIVENLVDNGTFVNDYDCDINRLCFIEDDNWLGDEQLFGVALLHHSTSDGYKEGDEQKIITALNQKAKIAEMINKYGFKFKPEDIKLHQYIMREI